MFQGVWVMVLAAMARIWMSPNAMTNWAVIESRDLMASGWSVE